MYKGFYGYQRGNVETRYTVEYIDDEATWHRFLQAQCKQSDIEPWEVRKKRVFDNISEAVSFFAVKYMHESTYDIQMWEEISLDGEVILEQHIEPTPTFAYCLRKVANPESQKAYEHLVASYKLLKQESEHYEKFIKQHHAEEQFEKWKGIEE